MRLLKIKPFEQICIGLVIRHFNFILIAHYATIMYIIDPLAGLTIIMSNSSGLLVCINSYLTVHDITHEFLPKGNTNQPLPQNDDGSTKHGILTGNFIELSLDLLLMYVLPVVQYDGITSRPGLID